MWAAPQLEQVDKLAAVKRKLAERRIPLRIGECFFFGLGMISPHWM
jgi:hypothetical protein